MFPRCNIGFRLMISIFALFGKDHDIITATATLNYVKVFLKQLVPLTGTDGKPRLRDAKSTFTLCIRLIKTG